MVMEIFKKSSNWSFELTFNENIKKRPLIMPPKQKSEAFTARKNSQHS